MSADFTGHGSQNDAHRFSTDTINNAIAEGYNFPVKEVILKAFSGIKGLKFKFFLSGIIILLVFFALFFLMAQLIPMPTSIYRMDFRYAASDLLIMSVSLWGIYIVLSLVSMIFTGGMTLIVMRHIRQEDNPLIPGVGFYRVVYSIRRKYCYEYPSKNKINAVSSRRDLAITSSRKIYRNLSS